MDAQRRTEPVTTGKQGRLPLGLESAKEARKSAKGQVNSEVADTIIVPLARYSG
ncbi:MAG: hypothetical protein WC708_13435 [Lentisphaeria bacterium]